MQLAEWGTQNGNKCLKPGENGSEQPLFCETSHYLMIAFTWERV